MKKLEAIQILRGAAALMVFHIHTLDIVEGSALPRQLSFFNTAHFGSCGVDLFFCISGFILGSIALRLRPTPSRPFVAAADFLSRRFLRILPIYWITSIFWIFLEAKHHHLTFAWFLNSMLLLPSFRFPMPLPVMFIGWTLVFEMFFYYLLTLNLLIGTRRIVERTIATILILITLGIFFGFARPILILVANPFNLEFVFGCIIALFFARVGKPDGNRSAIANIVTITGCVLLGSTYFLGKYNTGIADYILNGQLSWYRVLVWGVPAALITGGLAFRAPVVSSRSGRIAVAFGNASYSIYLVSGMVLYFYDRIYFIFAPLGPDLNIFFAVVSVATIGLLCHRFVETPINLYLASHYHRIALPYAESAPAPAPAPCV